jgi:hypothetical protein
MLRSILLILAAMALALPAHARLGETEDQCIARYGAPTSPAVDNNDNGVPTHEMFFQKDGYAITVNFLNGKAGTVQFWKKDISHDDINALLEANAQGGTWAVDDSPDYSGDAWHRNDGAEARAILNDITFISPEMQAAFDAARKAKDAQNTQGL